MDWLDRTLDDASHELGPPGSGAIMNRPMHTARLAYGSGRALAIRLDSLGG
jgi:hypothetical protein